MFLFIFICTCTIISVHAHTQFNSVFLFLYEGFGLLKPDSRLYAKGILDFVLSELKYNQYNMLLTTQTSVFLKMSQLSFDLRVPACHPLCTNRL